MVFCFASGCCISTTAATALVFVQVALEERTMQAAPLSSVEILKIYLMLCMLLRGIDG